MGLSPTQRRLSKDDLLGAGLSDAVSEAIPGALAAALPPSLAAAGIAADPRTAVPLLFNAGATGKAIAGVTAGAWVMRAQVFSGGLWASASLRLKIIGASGAITYGDAITQNTDQPVALSETSTLQVEVAGNPLSLPLGLYVMLAPPSRPDLLDPPIYFRAVEDSGITAATFEAPSSTKLKVGPYDFYNDKVAKPYAIQRAYNRLTGAFLPLFQYAVAPGDIPLNHGENDRAEHKGEYRVSPPDYHNCLPFNTLIAWTKDFIFPPGPRKKGGFGLQEQLHATEDNPTSSGGARLQDNFLSPVYAFQAYGTQDGSGDEILEIVTRGSSDPYQNAGNYTPVVHYSRRNDFRGKNLRLYTETVLSFSGQGILRVWLSENGGATWQQIVNATGLTNAYNDVYGPHYACGQYNAGEGTPFFQYVAEDKPQIVQQDNFEMVVGGDVSAGSTLRARMANPKPLSLPAEAQF